jgi:uncharacterized protein YceK
MKQIIFILTLVIGLSGCNNISTKKAADTLQTISSKRQAEIYIKDTSKYDPAFIAALDTYYEPIQLIDNFIITGKDTTYFPEDLPLNKKITFKGTTGKKNFALTVTRTNLTNLIYSFKRTDNDKTIDSISGRAILGPMFFLTSENDEDSQTGDGYGSSEYFDKSDNCWLAIRIGIGLDKNRKQRAKLAYGCEDKNKQALNLDECPTLRTE